MNCVMLVVINGRKGATSNVEFVIQSICQSIKGPPCGWLRSSRLYIKWTVVQLKPIIKRQLVH
ncbi:MAG: hypothetical protein ABSF92_14275 [Candidatus Acidiferrales bacterium]